MVTEQGPNGKVEPGRRILNIALGWLRRSVPVTTIIAALVLVGVAGAVFIVSGGVDVSADTRDSWLAEHLLHFVFKRSEASRSASAIPPADLYVPSRVRLAAQHFDMVCANCHGRPGFGQSVIALSMSPRPQYLPYVVGQFTDPELFRIVEHGVKYSAMPSWPTNTRSDEVWSMVAFLRQLPKLDANAYRAMTALPGTEAAAPTLSGGDTGLRPADPRRNTPPLDEFLYAAPSAGFADQTIHNTPAPTCARCHGADGSGAVTGGEAPNLTLQDPAYLQAALEAYTRGSRKSGYMQTIAAELSSGQIAALAHYYAGLPVQTAPLPPPATALVSRGEAIATQGIRETAVPACASCHDSNGSAITNAPHIAGQSVVFLRRELMAMRHGGRGSTEWWNPMPAVAHALSENEIAAVAAYYSTLKPMKAAGGAQSAEPPQATLAPQDTGVDLAAAKAIFQDQCVKCHVNNGRGDLQGDYPDLTLQTTRFAAQNLYAFHSGARPSDQMRQVTGGLSFADMNNLAHYVNTLTPQPALAKPDAAAALRGAAIATHGDPARGIPACLSCHGANGVAALPLIPRLQGQNVFYLRKRLAVFAEPYARNLSALNPMPLISGKLTDRERADLAAYFAAAPPLQKPAAQP